MASNGPSWLLHGGYHYDVSRSWQARAHLTKSMFMYPIFVTDDPDAEVVIDSLPGQKRWGINKLAAFVAPLVEKGLASVILFGVPVAAGVKDEWGTRADDPEGPVIQAIRLLRATFPDLFVCCDVCLCEYTSHGHCGHLRPDGTLDNAASVQRIAEVAVNYARAGAQAVAPSDMMDGRILGIKQGLIDAGLAHRTMLISYAAKFSSALYGPFRDAAGSTFKGHRRAYQLPHSARGLAHRAMARDAAQGADMIMIKPAVHYLDIVRDAATQCVPDLPISVYHVSGEYAMLHAGAAAGVYDLKQMAFETNEAFVRAGASMIVSYFTPDFLEWLS